MADIREGRGHMPNTTGPDVPLWNVMLLFMNLIDYKTVYLSQ